MKKQTHEEFVEKMTTINPSIEITSKYLSDRERVFCKCSICGYEWSDTASHLKQGRGCGNCLKLKRRQKNAENFFAEAKKIHSDNYDYSKFEYVNSQTKGIIICPIHGEFLQVPNSHINGRGCPLCAGNNYKRTSEEFIQRAIKIHGYKYDYSQVDYLTCKSKVLITCKKCGNSFYQTPDSHLQGKGCPNCKLQSQSELYEKLQQSFPTEKILFEVGKEIVPWLQTQRFDIYFPDYNIAIEYNGKQHYTPIKHFGGELGFIETQRRDTLKKDKCKRNACTLFEVKYDYTEEEYNELIMAIQNIICLS